jgi:hypothetical protein
MTGYADWRSFAAATRGAKLMEQRVVMDAHKLQHRIVVADRRPELLQDLQGVAEE